MERCLLPGWQTIGLQPCLFNVQLWTFFKQMHSLPHKLDFMVLPGRVLLFHFIERYSRQHFRIKWQPIVLSNCWNQLFPCSPHPLCQHCAVYRSTLDFRDFENEQAHHIQMSATIIIFIHFLSVVGSLVPTYSSSTDWSLGCERNLFTKNMKALLATCGKCQQSFNNCPQTSVSGGLSLTLTRWGPKGIHHGAPWGILEFIKQQGGGCNQVPQSDNDGCCCVFGDFWC